MGAASQAGKARPRQWQRRWSNQSIHQHRLLGLTSDARTPALRRLDQSAQLAPAAAQKGQRLQQSSLGELLLLACWHNSWRGLLSHGRHAHVLLVLVLVLQQLERIVQGRQEGGCRASAADTCRQLLKSVWTRQQRLQARAQPAHLPACALLPAQLQLRLVQCCLGSHTGTLWLLRCRRSQHSRRSKHSRTCCPRLLLLQARQLALSLGDHHLCEEGLQRLQRGQQLAKLRSAAWQALQQQGRCRQWQCPRPRRRLRLRQRLRFLGCSGATGASAAWRAGPAQKRGCKVCDGA